MRPSFGFQKFGVVAASGLMLFWTSGCVLSVNAQTVGHAVDQAGAAYGWNYGLPAYAEQVTDGGRGGKIVRVSSLESEGPGTLRAALSMEGARIVVFDVAGAIDLGGDNIRIDNADVTIAGQTAPSPGISILRGGLIIAADDVIVQHIRIRPGDLGEAPRSGRDIDSITTQSAHNVIVDHCSLSWATDENLSASGPRFTGEGPDAWREGTSRNILFSNNIIAEGLAYSTHAKGEHSKGSLIHDNVSDIVIYANLYTSNFERSPLFKGGVRGAIVNNFIYNPGQRAVHYNLQGLEWGAVPPATGQMDLVGNVMRAGPSTAVGVPLVMFGGEGDLSLFLQDNTAVDRWGQPAPVTGRYTMSEAGIVEADASHMDLSGLPILPSSRVEASVLAEAGARPWDRDTHDVRVLADAAEGRGGIIDSQDDVGGYPEVLASQRAFDASLWDLNDMSPRSSEALDSGSGARGT
jgi:hypothetical protein